MSTMCIEQPNFGNRVLVQSARTGALRPDLQDVVADIMALRAMTKKSGFRTSRGQNEILATLNGPDLAAVIRALDENETK